MESKIVVIDQGTIFLAVTQIGSCLFGTFTLSKKWKDDNIVKTHSLSLSTVLKQQSQLTYPVQSKNNYEFPEQHDKSS